MFLQTVSKHSQYIPLCGWQMLVHKLINLLHIQIQEIAIILLTRKYIPMITQPKSVYGRDFFLISVAHAGRVPISCAGEPPLVELLRGHTTVDQYAPVSAEEH